MLLCPIFNLQTIKYFFLCSLFHMSHKPQLPCGFRSFLGQKHLKRFVLGAAEDTEETNAFSLSFVIAKGHVYFKTN